MEKVPLALTLLMSTLIGLSTVFSFLLVLSSNIEVSTYLTVIFSNAKWPLSGRCGIFSKVYLSPDEPLPGFMLFQ